MKDSPLIDEVLDRYRQPLGPHYPRYRGHVYRMYHYTRYLISERGGDPAQDDTTIALAAAFHDLRFAGFVCRTLLLGALKQPWRPLPMLRW